MKIIAINGSPRKNWNDDKLIDAFVEGILQIVPAAEIQKVSLYDLKFSGCRSCFGCKLKTNVGHQCVIKDDLSQLLVQTRETDGLVLASPIYFMNVTGEMRCFMERLLYPGRFKKEVKLATIFTMNATEEVFQQLIKPETDLFIRQFEGSLNTTLCQQILAFDTYQRDDNGQYTASRFDHQKKYERFLEEWPKMKEEASKKGMAFARAIQEELS